MASMNARTPRAGERISATWQPRHIAGTIDEVSWQGWILDPSRPLVELALAHLRHGRDRVLGRRTVEAYDGVAARYIDYIECGPRRSGVERVRTRTAIVADLTTEGIYAFLQRPAARGGLVSVGAQRSEGGALHALAVFGMEIGAVAPEALRAFKLPEPDEDAVPTSLADAEIVRLLRHLSTDTSYEGCRFELFCRLELDTGARPEELAGVLATWINQAARSIRIRGKAGKLRTAFYGEGTAKVLARYLRFRGASKHPELFVGHRGRMTAGSFSHAFRKVADAMGLVGTGDGVEDTAPTLYILRRTFARRFAENGGAVEELARLMGHAPSSIPMLLRVYYRPSDERLRRAHERIRPLDALFDAA